LQTPTYEEMTKHAFVKCRTCQANHSLASDKFITIMGNVHVGTGGGVFGNADWKTFGVPVYHFCPDCLIEEIQRLNL
jgi:hypothetical protein